MSGVRLGVLVSGAGTNLQAIFDRLHKKQGIEIVAVASDRTDAPALARAEANRVATRAFPNSNYPNRAARDVALANWLKVEQGVDLVVLAGYMQLLTTEFLNRFPHKVINVHPALLPSFPGVRAIEQAFNYGVKVFGVTVHFVDEGVDTGPIILQQAVELPAPADPEEVHVKLRPIEHDLLCRAIELIANDQIQLDPINPRRVAVVQTTA